METKKAIIKRDTSNAYLVLDVNGKKLEIILTDDNPNNIMSAFNVLLKELKKGLFQFKLDDTKDDLYLHICKEYIKQLNAELKEVHNELGDFDLLEKK
jgi:hypothetical protein